MQASTAATPIRAGHSYRHEAFFYTGDDEYLAGTLPMVREGLAAGEAVMVAVPPRRLDLLRAALGGDGERVAFCDMTALGHNPANIIAAWAAFADRAAGEGLRMRGIGEPVWPGRSAAEVSECQLHEALLNLAVSPDTPLWLRCPYDAGELEQDVLQAAHRSHPVLTGPDSHDGSRSYGGAHHAATLFSEPLPEPPAVAEQVAFGRHDLRRLRSVVRSHAVGAGLDADRSQDLVLAVHELAANSVEHGGGAGTVRLWRSRAGLVCEVRDAGIVSDPLVGRLAASDGAEGGRGVWMANQLCDLVQLRSSPEGTTVRLLARVA
jgi:anti-sigma regulatory factor (Ser/Thr protein kinase)